MPRGPITAAWPSTARCAAGWRQRAEEALRTQQCAAQQARQAQQAQQRRQAASNAVERAWWYQRQASGLMGSPAASPAGTAQHSTAQHSTAQHSTHLVVPAPGLRVDGLAHGAQDAQAGAPAGRKRVTAAAGGGPARLRAAAARPGGRRARWRAPGPGRACPGWPPHAAPRLPPAPPRRPPVPLHVLVAVRRHMWQPAARPHMPCGLQKSGGDTPPASHPPVPLHGPVAVRHERADQGGRRVEHGHAVPAGQYGAVHTQEMVGAGEA